MGYPRQNAPGLEHRNRLLTCYAVRRDETSPLRCGKRDKVLMPRELIRIEAPHPAGVICLLRLSRTAIWRMAGITSVLICVIDTSLRHAQAQAGAIGSVRKWLAFFLLRRTCGIARPSRHKMLNYIYELTKTCSHSLGHRGSAGGNSYLDVRLMNALGAGRGVHWDDHAGRVTAGPV
jgi:hypothetical protein